jgi:hypothetical protein
MWPAGITAMILIAFWQIRHNMEDGWFNLALYEFCIMNVLFFLVWIRMRQCVYFISLFMILIHFSPLSFI